MNLIKGLFGSKVNKNAVQNDDQKLLKCLSEAIQQLGFGTEITNGEVRITECQMSIWARIDSKTLPSDVTLVQLNFRITQKQFEGDIFESLAGLGEGNDIVGAIQNGVSSFVSGVLTVFLEALDERHNPEVDFETQFGEMISIWHPKVGPLQTQGKWDNCDMDENRIYGIVKDDLRIRLGNQRFYWIKVFVARQAEGDLITECTLNNAPIYQIQTKLENYAKGWNTCAAFRSEKQYIIIRQCDKTYHPSKYTTQRLQELIVKAIKILEDCSTSSQYDRAFDRILNLAKDIELAVELYSFLPEVYCRMVLPQVQYSDEIIIVRPDETQQDMYLSQFGIYGQIRSMALERFHGGINKDKAKNIILLSANFDAINQALNQGSQLENLVTGPLMMMVPEGYKPFR